MKTETDGCGLKDLSKVLFILHPSSFILHPLEPIFTPVGAGTIIQ